MGLIAIGNVIIPLIISDFFRINPYRKGDKNDEKNDLKTNKEIEFYDCYAIIKNLSLFITL